MRIPRLTFACLLACLALAPTAGAHALIVGAAEDSVRWWAGFSDAQSRMDLAKLAGLNAVRATVLWQRGTTKLADVDAAGLTNASAAARMAGIRLYVSLYPSGSSQTPVTAAQRADFAAWAADTAAQLPDVGSFIVGNEPNLNRFWLPQFDQRGGDAAAKAYELLLAQTYDALKAVGRKLTVIGGAVSPRGSDDPTATRKTHSPTRFIADLGTAYRATGRTQPIMDAFAFHPYLETSATPPTKRHLHSTTISVADYGKLVTLLGRAFDGTKQKGSTLPILYDEFGVQTRIGTEKVDAYANLDAPAAQDAVSEATQAAYYREALALAACQPRVIGLFFFHLVDETDLAAWQSGLYYADGTPKSSLEPVKQAAAGAEAGNLGACS